MKKKLFIVTTVPGTLRFFHALGEKLHKAEWSVTAVSANGDELEKICRAEGFKSSKIRLTRRISPFTDLIALAQLWTLLRQERPSLIHAHTPKAGLVAMLAGWLSGVPVRIYHIHGLPIETAGFLKAICLWLSDFLAISCATKVLCVSKSVQKALTNHRLLPRAKESKVLLEGTLCGIDVHNQFQDDSVQHAKMRATVRNKFGIPDSATVIGYVGRFVRDKGIQELVQAWEEIKNECDDTRVLMVGDRDAAGGTDEDALQRVQNDTDWSWAGWDLDIAKYYAAMDFLVLPSYREGFPTVVLEAAAMGKPAIVTDATGCIDAVKHQKTGIIVPVKSSLALAGALRKYLNDTPLRRGHGKAARERVKAMFEQKKVQARLIQEYNNSFSNLQQNYFLSKKFFLEKIYLRLSDVIKAARVPFPSLPSKSFRKWPFFDEQQKKAVDRVLRSGRVNYWTGEEGRSFEREYAHHLGVQHAVAVSNGTVALELALFAVGLKNDDEVVIPSRTFIGTASAVVARGGIPICADIDTATQNVTAETLKAAVTEKTRGIIVVHLGGWPCDMDSIMEFAKERDLFVIEDCAQAHGAKYKGRPVGSFGDINAFSFCQDKIITTGGEGGLLATNDRELWQRAWSYKDHGKNWDTVNSQNQTGGFRYLHDSFGSNYRMTEMQAAIGRLQLKKLPEWHHHRSKNAMTLQDSLFGCPGLFVPRPSVDYEHAYYRLYALMDKSQLTADWNRDKIIKNCQARGIQVGSGSCGEIYLEKAFQQFGTPPRLPGAFQAQETSLAFLVDPTFTERDMQRVGKIVVDIMEKATSNSKQRRLRAA